MGSMATARSSMGGSRFTRTIDRTIVLHGARNIELRSKNVAFAIDATDARHQARVAARQAMPNVDGDAIALHGTVSAPTQALVDDIVVDVVLDRDTARVTIATRGGQDRFDGDFAVALPAQRSLLVTTSNGSVAVADHRGSLRIVTTNGGVHVVRPHAPVDVSSTNGGIDVREARSSLGLSTTNGAITATVDPSWIGSTITATTTNGEIEIGVPHGVSASLHGRTTNGSVRNDARAPDGTTPTRIAITAVSTNGDIVVR